MKPCQIKIANELTFTDRLLPENSCSLSEHEQFSKSYFVDLHNRVKAFGVHNYKGARIPLAHNNINVKKFRSYLLEFSYPHIHLLQFIEFGFPLGLWTDAFLQPSTSNHSSAYTYHSYIDKFVESELIKLGVTGPFESSPWEQIMVSPLMTAPKKPASRRAVFDASFGLFSLNKNTPEKAYHDSEYEFTFPKIDDLADKIAELGQNCLIWKRDLSRFFLQLKIDPYEYDRMGFVWRSKLFLFVSFVWGCRHAGYAGQWLTSAVNFILACIGSKLTGQQFFAINYADDFAGAEGTLSRATLAYETLGNLLSELGIHEALAKANPPCTRMTYLGVLFDTSDMKMYVDGEKVIELKA